MRQAYKDPMNKEDGSWRLIYVGAAGQLIGSLKPRQNLQLPQAGGIGTPANALNGPGGPGQPGTTGQPGAFGQPSTGGQARQRGTPPCATRSGTNQPTTTGPVENEDQGDPGSQTIPTGPPPTIVGGNNMG